MRVGVGVALVVWWFSASRQLSAQRRDSLPVAVGARVRVILTERPVVRIVGAYVGADSARLTVHDERAGIPVGAEWREIESVELFRPGLTSGEAFGRGARAGAVIAGTLAVAGVAYGIVWDSRRTCDNVDECYPHSGVLGAVVLGYLGSVGGTIIGGTAGLLFRDRWKSVWRPR